MQPAHQERIFRMFQPLHARDEYAGTEIGLSIVTKGVERHGGRVWASDTEGGGATFSFTIPDVAEEGQVRGLRNPPASSTPQSRW